MKVLVVDDDVVARMMLMHLIDSCGGHEIVEAEDGEQAWRQLQDGLAPDIVFCDLRMPHLSGLELLQRLRAHPALAALPFVLVSAAAEGDVRIDAMAAGASGYIVKPFRHQDVLAQFERLPAHAGSDEAPHATAQRLGIDIARLRLYLDGLGRQLEAAAHELAGADPATVGARLARLREGCLTLGLHDAAAQLDAVPAPEDAARVKASLARAGQLVARQIERAALA